MNLRHDIFFNPKALRAVFLGVAQKFLGRNVHVTLRHDLMSLHNCSVNVFSFSVKFISAFAFDSFLATGEFPVSLTNTIPTLFPVPLFKRNLCLIRTVNSNLARALVLVTLTRSKELQSPLFVFWYNCVLKLSVKHFSVLIVSG